MPNFPVFGSCKTTHEIVIANFFAFERFPYKDFFILFDAVSIVFCKVYQTSDGRIIMRHYLFVLQEVVHKIKEQFRGCADEFMLSPHSNEAKVSIN